MLLTEIDHVAIAVRDLEAAIEYYQRAFGATVDHREVVESDGVTPRGASQRYGGSVRARLGNGGGRRDPVGPVSCSVTNIARSPDAAIGGPIFFNRLTWIAFL